MKIFLMQDDQITGFDFEQAIVDFATRLSLEPENVRGIVYSEFQPGGLIDQYRLGLIQTPDFMVEFSEAFDKMPVDVLQAWTSLIELNQNTVNNLYILLNNICYPGVQDIHVVSTMTPTHYDTLLSKFVEYDLDLSHDQFTVAFESKYRTNNINLLKESAKQDIQNLYGPFVKIEDLTEKPSIVEDLVSNYLTACGDLKISKFK